MKPTLIPLILILPCAFAFDAHAEPPKGSPWVTIPELTDEFNGHSLDTEKWHDHNPRWKGRKPGFFSPNNVAVKDGELQLTAKAEDRPDVPSGYHTFTTAAVKSTTLVKYGYFEARCKAMDSRASSAFWFYQNTPEIWTEIDVFEIGGRAPGHEKAVHMNAHVFHTPNYKGTTKDHITDPKTWEAAGRLADRYHVYGLEWDKNHIKWYVDGKCVRTKKNEYWHQPLHMNFDSETMGNWFGLPKKENLPSTFRIDYIRSWKKVKSGVRE